MLRILLLVLLAVFISTSPDLRLTTANALRDAAKWIQPEKNLTENRKYFLIPNPFYKKQKNDLD